MTHSSVTHGDTFTAQLKHIVTHSKHTVTFTIFECDICLDISTIYEMHLGTCITHVNTLTRSQFLQYITTPETYMTQTQHLRHIIIHSQHRKLIQNT